ncbi:MAG: AraC family transcriptional regulator [Kordia sp.]|nr:MAG: AraC family transcriptional regulator [Kordia sp.]
MIFIAGISIALFISFLLISKKNKSNTDQLLITWMLLTAIHLFLYYITYTKDIFQYPFLLGIELPMPLLHGVLLYLYIATVTSQLPQKKGLLILHFFPIIATYLYLITFFMLSVAEKIYVIKNNGAGYELFSSILSTTISISGAIYVLWSYILLRKYKRIVHNNNQESKKVNTKWLQLLIGGLGVIWIVVIFTEKEPLIFLSVVLFVFSISFYGIKQGNIFTLTKSDNPIKTQSTEIKPIQKLQKLITIKEVPKEKYAKSGLKEEASEKLFQELTLLMTHKTIYQNGELSVGELASILKVHPNYLSQIINEREGINFYEYVNHFRVEEFKRLITIPKNQKITLLSLAYDCGFNSKSSFNRYFKKSTGQTPSQYAASLTKN